jgi:hypothetical protein
VTLTVTLLSDVKDLSHGQGDRRQEIDRNEAVLGGAEGIRGLNAVYDHALAGNAALE